MVLLVGLLGTLIACTKEEPITEAPELVPLEAELTVTATGEDVVMEALVTQGDEKIDDADEVVYEVWEEGKKSEGEMIDAVNEKDGLYTAETSFDKDGLFHIQVHVTANGMHVMPKKTVTIGDGGDYEEGQGDDHHTEGFSMHFMKPESIEASKEVELIVHLELDGSSFEQANVRYEIWDDNKDTKHEWIDTEESSPGEYLATFVFEETGTYKIQIHVEDDNDLHEHEEHELEVQ